MKRIIVIAVFLVLLIIVVALLNKYKTKTANLKPASLPTVMVGGDRDIHGCIGSAGYTWCQPKNSCIRIWEEACYADVEEEIQYILAKKYNKSPSEVKITISKQDNDYVAGSVMFGEGSPGEGGIFLAQKTGRIWEVVFDGNGNVDCNKVRQEYGFPDTILKPNFCD